MKRVIVTVSNDLISDNRVHKVCSSLHNSNYSVLLVGRRKFFEKRRLDRPYATHRMALLFRKSFLFYAELNIRMLLLLLFRKADILLSNDLDTLPANGIISKWKSCFLVYDSHELFTEVPELVGRLKVKAIWEKLENKFIKRANISFTVSSSIAKYYMEKYKIVMHVVRNLPLRIDMTNKDDVNNQNIIVYQGALNINRGIEHMIYAMQYIENAVFHIYGRWDIEKDLQKLAKRLQLTDKVKFLGRVPLELLQENTRGARLGISLEEDYGLNYRYALPNKLFDYIQNRIPVLISDLPEMRSIVKQYNIGLIAESHDAQYLARMVNSFLSGEICIENIENNLNDAASELNWDLEEKVLLELFSRLD